MNIVNTYEHIFNTLNPFLMIKKTYHITKTADGWQSKLEGAKRASKIGTTKAEVLQSAIYLAKKTGSSSVVIHRQNGKIQEERTYPKSIDPKTSKG
jgi:hypothetical protein